MSETKYRNATHEDIPAVIALGKIMAKESPRFQFITFNDEKLARILGISVEQGGLFLAEKEGELIGFFIGVVDAHYFSDDLQGIDLAVFVHPDHRKGRTGIKLIKLFEEFAFSMGAKVTLVSSNTGVNPERTMRLFSNLGYENGGNNMWKRNPGHV